MLYSSTRGKDNNLKFTEVLLNGLAKDGGLYVPNKIPQLSKKTIESLRGLKYSDLVYEVTKYFVDSDQIPRKAYKKICEKTYKKVFGKKIISIKKLNEKEYLLNLFHGPTFAFKDYALQLLGNIYDYVLREKKIELTILGATSGDTGSAAIYGCSKSRNIKMFILFPEGKVSEIQRKQMTTYKGTNVTNIAVQGNFDDCQRLVKDFFKLNNRKKIYNLAAVNSINWIRIMGQIVYYFWSFLNVQKDFNPINFVVPTGNFGNVYAGFISKLMGLPINCFIVSSNKNDILTRFFSSGEMKVRKTQRSISPSMDIQISSNFERLLFFFLKQGSQIRKLFSDLDCSGSFKIPEETMAKISEFFKAGRIKDNETLKTINYVYEKYGIIIDPHTAVGCSVGKKHLDGTNKNIYLATAHYGKFLDSVRKAISANLQYPLKLQSVLNKREDFELIGNDLKELQDLMARKSN